MKSLQKHCSSMTIWVAGPFVKPLSEWVAVAQTGLVCPLQDVPPPAAESLPEACKLWAVCTSVRRAAASPPQPPEAPTKLNKTHTASALWEDTFLTEPLAKSSNFSREHRTPSPPRPPEAPTPPDRPRPPPRAVAGTSPPPSVALLFSRWLRLPSRCARAAAAPLRARAPRAFSSSPSPFLSDGGDDR